MNKFYKTKLLITIFYKFFNNNDNSFRTLMYHSIQDDRSILDKNDIWILKKSIFKEQINQIKKNKNFYKSDILLSDCPKNGISITFDDGYLDTYEIAAPYLIENNIPFTIL